MICITNKHNCCGCSACVQVCPRKCISFDEDEQGFKYPLVNTEICVKCGLCVKVCPYLNPTDTIRPLNVYAAKNTNEEIRKLSSSGGVFSIIAENVINKGGVVFGASFDNKWNVIHDHTGTIEGIEAFRGSKYVQSNIKESYVDARRFLNEGCYVLFSGTPCQIAGLKRFLRKDYDNLLTLDVVCHGVSSPKLWREYLTNVVDSSRIYSVSFKDKSSGWRKYSFTIKGEFGIFTEIASKNKYMISYTQNLNLRPSCFNCPAKAGRSGSDITLADYWGIEHIIPEFDDNEGISFVCANTTKGQQMIGNIECVLVPTDYEQSVPYNSCIQISTTKPKAYDAFWAKYNKQGIKAVFDLKGPQRGLLRRIINRLIKL